MKKFLFAIGLLLCAGQLFAQKDTIAVIGHWKNTDMRDFKVSKINSRQNENGDMVSDTTTYEFRFIILGSTPDGYRIKWQFEETPLLDELSEDEYEELENLTSEVRIIYTTDKQGIFKSVENWLEIADYYTTYYNVRLREIGNDTSAAARSYIEAKKAIATKEGVENLLYNEMRLFQMPYGYRAAIGDTIQYLRRKQVEPIDEDASAHLKYYFDHIDLQKNEAVFNMINTIDAVDANQKLQAVLKKYIKSMPEGTAEEKKDKAEATEYLPHLKYENDDTITCKFNTKTGILSKIDFRRSVVLDAKIEKSKTVKEVIIEQL